LFTCPPVCLTAQFSDNSGALFLSLPIGAQAVGMGQTAVTMEGRGEAVFWNPAGLATMQSSEFAVENASLAAGNAHALTAYFPAHSFGVFGGAVYLLDYGSLDRTDSTNNVVAQIAPRNLEFLASYSAEIAGSLTLGINYKLVQTRLSCSGDCEAVASSQGTAHGFDLGGQLNVGPDGALRLGVALKNIGLKLPDQADPLPARLVLGALYRLGAHVAGSGAARPRAGTPPNPGGEATAANGTGNGGIDVEVAADLDSPWRGEGESQMRFGVDVGYQRLVRVRGGYAFAGSGVSGPSFGMGLSSGAIGFDLARTFASSSDFIDDNPTFFTFHLTF